MPIREDIKAELGAKLDAEASKKSKLGGYGMTIGWVRTGEDITGYEVRVTLGDGLDHTFPAKAANGRPSDAELEVIIEKHGADVLEEVKRIRAAAEEGKSR